MLCSRALLWSLMLIGGLGAPLGCGGPGSTAYPVTGQVTFEGQPLESGEILFRDVQGNAGSAAGKIVDGEYELQVTPGAKRVEIVATRIVQAAPSPSGEPAARPEMFIPPRYNSQSELTAEVTADGENEFHFALTP